MRGTPDIRKRELAQIHIGKTALGMDDETYRAMLWSMEHVRSSGELDPSGRHRVLKRMRELGWRNDRKRVTPPSAAKDKRALMRKIAAMLSAGGRPWVYADGMARKMFQVEKAIWCDVQQLRKIIAALGYDARRRQEKADD